jgi:hypothetical protein
MMVAIYVLILLAIYHEYLLLCHNSVEEVGLESNKRDEAA